VVEKVDEGLSGDNTRLDGLRELGEDLGFVKEGAQRVTEQGEQRGESMR
jgi:hypothetical protein